MGSIKEALRELQLEVYIESFESKGIYDLRQLLVLPRAELDQKLEGIIEKKGHRLKFRKFLEEKAKNTQINREVSPTPQKKPHFEPTPQQSPSSVPPPLTAPSPSHTPPGFCTPSGPPQCTFQESQQFPANSQFNTLTPQRLPNQTSQLNTPVQSLENDLSNLEQAMSSIVGIRNDLVGRLHRIANLDLDQYYKALEDLRRLQALARQFMNSQ